MHAAVALAYCYYFLVRDKFVRDCALRATKSLKTSKLATVYGQAQKLYDHLITTSAAT
jgi:hypothetical protein